MHPAGNQAATTAPMDFQGSALGLFFRYLLVIFCSLLIIPYPWFAVLFITWFIANLNFGGRRIEFFGQCRESWWMFVLIALFSFYPVFLSVTTDIAETSPGKWQAVNLIISLVNVAVAYFILRWIISHIRAEDGETFEFTGGLWGFLWRNLVIFLLFLTIIGWAWGATMLLRWIARNIRGEGTSLTFEGSGWGILWRSSVPIIAAGVAAGMLGAAGLFKESAHTNTLLAGIGGLAVLACLAAAPWYFRWIIRWVFSSTLVHTVPAAPEDDFEFVPESGEPEFDAQNSNPPESVVRNSVAEATASSVRTSSVRASSIQTPSAQTSAVQASSVQASSVQTSSVPAVSIQASSVQASSVQTVPPNPNRLQQSPHQVSARPPISNGAAPGAQKAKL